ncbi:MAG: ABC transporter substrate-binding protein, partial [Rhodospirillales bacterium]|nr:ABC transporter substrate-binding protein [Rhodospirillales bacterium]
FEALPKDLQKIVEYAAQASAHEALADFTRHNAKFLDILVKEHGVRLHTWPDDIVAALGTATKEVLAELAATDEMTAKINQSFTAYLNEARNWSKWSDQRFLAMREAALG